MRLELAIYFSIQARDLGAAHLFSRWRSRCGFSRPLRLNALQEVAAQSRSAWPLFGFRLFLYLFWFRFFRRGRFWLCLLHRFWCRRSLLGRRRRCRFRLWRRHDFGRFGRGFLSRANFGGLAWRQDRKSVVWGKSVSLRVELGGRR